MLEEIWSQRLAVAAGLVAGAVCWLAIHASTESVFGTPLAAILGGFGGNLLRAPRAPIAPRDELFASLFGGSLAAVALHSLAQGGLF